MNNSADKKETAAKPEIFEKWNSKKFVWENLGAN